MARPTLDKGMEVRCKTLINRRFRAKHVMMIYVTDACHLEVNYYTTAGMFEAVNRQLFVADVLNRASPTGTSLAQ